jgi:hypothetical protein
LKKGLNVFVEVTKGAVMFRFDTMKIWSENVLEMV